MLAVRSRAHREAQARVSDIQQCGGNQVESGAHPVARAFTSHGPGRLKLGVSHALCSFLAAWSALSALRPRGACGPRRL